jgi:hypothetical protein
VSTSDFDHMALKSAEKMAYHQKSVKFFWTLRDRGGDSAA